MSFRAPRYPSPSKRAPAVTSARPFELIPSDSVPVERKPWGSGNLTVLPRRDFVAPDGTWAQPHVTSANSGDSSNLPTDAGSGAHDVLTPSAHTKKKERQWQKWANETIPALLQPYLTLLRETDSLRESVSSASEVTCACRSHVRKISVACVYFERIKVIKVCSCSAALQLLSRGLFPCAPVEPSLAVDLNMLDYVKELFVRTPPNTTAWCDTLEAFLGNRKYKLKTKDSLRRRFGSALHWYAKLIDAKNKIVGQHLDDARQRLLTVQDIDSVANEPNMDNVDDSAQNKDSAQNEDSDQNKNSDHSDVRTRPSDYLRSRCPLCFGSEQCHNPDFTADVIVCLDACFTQKRRKNPRGGGRGPLDIHADTVFLSEAQVKEMEEVVAEKHPARSTTRKSKSKDVSDSATAEDGYEPSMKVPTSVLNGCYESFTAADSKRVKASTQMFSDTGLMGLLCRHDRVLWLANMTSPGERQHYALALVKQLFEHLPPAMTVGLLYDIGCQLHRSCVKWDFLEKDIMDRLVFGISVFHAFGHQWACQMIYHPRKCTGFGLTDGEGCERFWSSIKILIPSLRVSGFYQRLYTIDNQVEYLDEKSLKELGQWLLCKWKQCQERKTKAEATLALVNIAPEILRQEWAAQIVEQTKPLKKQSKNNANLAVTNVMTLISTRKGFQDNIAQLNLMLASGDYDNLEIEDLASQKTAIETHLEKIQNTIKKKRELLGVDGRANLAKLKNNKFLQVRMNASVLKNRIRTRLRDRKFELDRLERAYRQTTSSEHKLHNHVKSSVKRHEPGVVQLANKYNKLCDELVALKRSGQALAKAIIPAKIEREGLFKLDVDDDIWQDIGLDDDSDTGAIPAWLGDENTRNGIKAIVELDRCKEEEQRLGMEHCTMQEWMMEEWHAVLHALEDCDNENMKYQLQQRKLYLCHLCAVWEQKTKTLPSRYDMPATWGPTEVELMEALQLDQSASWDNETEDDAAESDADSELDGDDEELLEAIELSALADAYRQEGNMASSELFMEIRNDTWNIDALLMSGTPGPSRNSSPRKRNRPEGDNVYIN
ncbi:hypothetical protein Hypma_012501 [Hypsizygus marmoreus]|uniref:CxC1-like cysteine cluster associated with KDZ transposases domain-containing protein n=1 Tax=Hypsizygus marmoreus TaxID=39966 RepID=A0A369JJ16_HYPMA|nr:hypothetical protein Hypma_012501 [Hypsizygus marmoreus]